MQSQRFLFKAWSTVERVACDIAGERETPRPHSVTSPPNGGNYAIQGSDTPTTRGQRASHGAKPPPTPSHQHVTLHDPDSKAECAAYTTNRTERKGDARQFPAQQEPRPLITRPGLSLTRTRPHEARDSGRVRWRPAASGRMGASIYTGCFTGVRDKELLRNSDERNRL